MSPGRDSGFGQVTNATLETMKELIELWVNSEVGGKQGSVLNHKGYRIDQQKNNGFDKTVTDDDGTHTQRYNVLAVQKGSSVFANVMLPMGVHIGDGLIRKALHESLERGQTVTLLPAKKDQQPKDQKLRYHYVLTWEGM